MQPGNPLNQQSGRSARTYPDLDTLGDLGKQVTKHLRLTVTYEREVRREVPAGNVDVRAGLFQFTGDAGKGFCPVDQDLHLVALARRGISGRPASRRRVEGAKLANPREPAAVMRNDEPLDRLAHRIVQS